jgi:hypothetical protein
MSTTRRRLAGAAAVALTAVALLPLVAPAADAGPADGTSKNPARIGLYGQQTPTYDGVYRQGLSILALDASGARVADEAVNWLRRQQCGNGSWTSFRSDLDTPCGVADSNATAMAVMALKAVGRTTAALKGLDWLVAHQLSGGGWEYSTGWGPDSNSTGLVVQALIAMKVDPETVENNGTPFDFLASLQLDCDSDKVNQRGSLDYQAQDPLVRNDFATAQATQALARSKLPVAPHTGTNQLPQLECGGKVTTPADTPAEAAAGYLGRRLASHNGTIPFAGSGDPDYGSTTNAVLSLVAAGFGANQVELAMNKLERAVRTYVLDDDRKILPAAAAALVLAERATGGNPRNVDGMDLIKRLRNSITERAGSR